MSLYPDPKKILLPGNAAFKIEKIWDRDKEGRPLVSKAGNTMIRLKLMVTDSQGEKSEVWDYVLLNSPKKITALLQSIGRADWIEDINTNTFDPLNLVGKTGRCSVQTDQHEVYGTKTVIGWYLKKAPLQKDNTLAEATNQYKVQSNEDTPFSASAPEESAADREDLPF